VDNSAAGPGTGTSQDPFSTIAAAIAYVIPHDYIILRPGTYYERVDLPYFVFLRSEQGPEVTTIDATGLGGTHAVTLATLGEVTGLTITKRDGGGIYSSTSTSEFGRIIKGNRVIDCPNGGIDLDGPMHPALAENLIVNCGPFGVRLQNGVAPYFTGATITGCTVGLDYDPSVPLDPAAFVANSIFWGNGTDVIGLAPADLISCDVGDPAFVGVNGSISADPRWFDGATGDFRLRRDSPCVDNGAYFYALNSSEFDNRGYGNQRKMDGDLDGVVMPDMGAFERGGLEMRQQGSGAGSVVTVDLETGPHSQWFLAYGSYDITPVVPFPTAGSTSYYLWLNQGTLDLVGTGFMDHTGRDQFGVVVPPWAVGQAVDVQGLGVDWSGGGLIFSFTNAERIVIQ